MGGTLTKDINVCFKNKLRANKDISHLSTLKMQNVSAVIESLSKRRFCQHGRQPEVSCVVTDGE